jgi:hypothetical protein
VEVRLHTRTDAEAIDVEKGRTGMSAAVIRLVRIVPPARLDLIDNVLASIGRRDVGAALDWPPVTLVHQLVYRVKRVHAGEVRMRGPNGAVVDVVRYRDKLGYDRRCYRLTRHGVFIGEYKTPEELGKVISLAELIEDDVNQPATPTAE